MKNRSNEGGGGNGDKVCHQQPLKTCAGAKKNRTLRVLVSSFTTIGGLILIGWLIAFHDHHAVR
jgi:hypothetical protein